MDKLFLKKDLVTGCKLTQDGVLTYIALRAIMDQSIPLYNKTSVVDCISVNRMAYSLIGLQEKYEKVFLDSLQRGIYELQLANVIRVLQNFSTKTSNEYLLDFSNLYLDTEKEQFVTIFSEEIYKILACEEVMKKKISMLKYFVAIVSTFNWSKSMRKLQGKIGAMSMEYIALQADISSRICIRYNDILSEMKMIYVYKSNDKERVGDKLRQIKNCYSRYADKDACEEYASNYENWYGSQHIIVRTQKNKEQADNNRRLAQIYNRICDGYGDTYDEETIRKVRKYIVNKNKTLQEEIDAKHAQEYMTDSDRRWVENLESQIKDESIFEQFDFLKDDDNWGEPIDFSVEEILDIPIEGEVQMNLPLENADCEVQSDLANTVCIGHNELCKVIPPNNSDIADNESHGCKIEHGIFCVTGNDLEFIDFEDDKIVI